MKRFLYLCILVLLVAAMTLSGCADEPAEEPVEEPAPEEPAEPTEIELTDEAPESSYDDGLYRGTYGDRGDQQVSVQFQLTNGVISDLGYRHLYYRDIDFREIDEDHTMYPVKIQHRQIAEHLENKALDQLNDLYEPEEFVEDIDTYSGATIRASKVHSAIQDALNRGVYSPKESVYAHLPADYDDGIYRGLFEDGGFQQLGVQFELVDNTIQEVSFRQLYYAETDFLRISEEDPWFPVKEQHEQLAAHLEGQPVETIFDLFNPHQFVEDIDTYSGATIRANKMFSAIKDGLNRGVYTPTDGVTTDIGPYPDGRYRGLFSDRGNQQISLQFHLEDETLTDLSFRRLNYRDIDFLELEEGEERYPIMEQHEQILDYLEGQSLEAIFDLYEPGEFVEDIDTYSGATIRANKVLSAIRDGLNRGLY